MYILKQFKNYSKYFAQNQSFQQSPPISTILRETFQIRSWKQLFQAKLSRNHRHTTYIEPTLAIHILLW